MTGRLWTAGTWFDSAGQFHTRLAIFINTNCSGPNLPNTVQTCTPAGGTLASALDVQSDVQMSIISQTPTVDYAFGYLGASNYAGFSGPGCYVWSILPDGTMAWGASGLLPGNCTGSAALQANLDTFLIRGNAANTIQLGGPDTQAPAAQHFTTQNVHVPISFTSNSNQSAGQNVLVIDSGGEQLRHIFVGQTVVDLSTPGAIPPSTTVTSISYTTNSMTLSNNLAGGGVLITDIIQFTSPNANGADTYISGSQGTGTGVGGTIHLQGSPAGTSGSSQNAEQDYLQIVPVLPTSGGANAGVRLVNNGAGAVGSVQQLTFVPNSGQPVGLGIANGGTQLGLFSGSAAPGLSFTNSVITIRSDGNVSFTNASNNAFSTVDTGIARNVAGVVEIDNSINGTLREILVRSYVGGGSTPTNSGTCAITTQVGGNTVGTFVASGACAAGTYILAFGYTAPNGWSCSAQDRTTITDNVQQISSTTTAATFRATTANLDVVQFKCMAY
jgi:hypothetical protein